MGPKIDQADKPFAGRTGPLLPGRPHDERDAYAGVVEPALGAGQAVAVIAPEKDDGIVGKAILFQLAQNFAGLLVETGNVVIMLGQLAPHFRGVRIVRGQFERIRVCGRFLVRSNPASALVGDPEIENGKERLAFLAKRTAPVRAALVLVPDRDGGTDLVIGFEIIRREVAGRPEILRESFHVRRRGSMIRRGNARRIVRRAHMMPSPTVLVHARDNGRPARRAHSGGGEGLRVPGPLGSKAVEVGRVRHGVAVGAEP